MQGQYKPYQELIVENALLKQRIHDQERSENERKQAEKALQESEKKYRQLFMNAPTAIYEVDYKNRRFIDFNEIISTMTGYSKEELMQMDPWDLLTEESRKTYLDRMKLMKEGRNVSDSQEYTVRKKDGGIIWVNMNINYIVEDGLPEKARIVVHDITERKQMEETLRESEEKFRNLAEKSIVGIYLIQDGVFKYVNSRQAEICEYRIEEMIDKAMVRDVVYPEDWPLVEGNMRKRICGESTFLHYAFRVYTKNKKIKYTEVYSSRTMYQGKLAIIGTMLDITDLKQSGEALRKSEATLQSVFKATPVGIALMKDRVFQRINNAWCKIFGYSESDVIGHTFRMAYDNEAEYERVGQELYASILGSGMIPVQTRLRRKDGVFRDITLTAAPLHLEDISLGTVVAAEDITDHKKTEEDLKKNRRELADIIEFLPDATFVIDKEDSVIAWNRAIEIMTGIRKEDMLGKSNNEYSLAFYGDRRYMLIDHVLHPDREMQSHYTAIQRVGDMLFGEAFIPNLPHGSTHLSATTSVLRNEKREIVAAIECLRDNTERKKLEERLNRAEKMEVLGRLAGGVAHDLNNVLGVLVGYSELLAEELPQGSPLKRYTDNILNSSVKSAAIIQDLLTLARRGVAVSELVRLNNIVHDYLQSPEFEKLQSHHRHVNIYTELANDLLNIKGSPVHLSKTAMNLISNAAEAISDRGEVRIKTENRHLDRPIRGYDEMKEGDYVALTVSDTGSGISANDIGKIFEPFYTKKIMGRSGTGLGLAVVWGTVKDHNGYIDVQSEEGKGSVFTLYFPATREEQAEAAEAVSTEAYKGKGESVLVVDDVAEQRELAINMLTRLGYRVDAVTDGEKAVEYLKNKNVDLVVLDMIMDPGIDGMETYRRILEIAPGQKAIIASGFSETDRVKKTQEMGAGEFVRKPYVMEKIGLAIKNELNRK